MAQVTRRLGFAPGSVHVGFVVDKLALGQVFLRVFRFPLSVAFHRVSILLYMFWGMHSTPVLARSSETLIVLPHRRERQDFKRTRREAQRMYELQKFVSSLHL
jgi:hypothetical protein